MEVKPVNFLALINAERASGVPISEEHLALELAIKEYLKNHPEEALQDYPLERAELNASPLGKIRAEASVPIAKETPPFVVEVNGKKQIIAVKNPDELRKIVDKSSALEVNLPSFVKEDKKEKALTATQEKALSSLGIDLAHLNRGEDKLREVQLAKEANLSLIEMRRSRLYGRLANDISATALVKGYVRNRNDARLSKQKRLENASGSKELGPRIEKKVKRASLALALATAYRHKKKKDEAEAVRQKALQAMKEKEIEAKDKSLQQEEEKKQIQQREAYNILYLKALKERGYSVRG